jgi:hypothetical protein
MVQLVTHAVLEKSVQEMNVSEAVRVGCQQVMSGKKAWQEDLAHGLISDKEYKRLVSKLAVDVQRNLRKTEPDATLEIPLAVVPKDDDFTVRVAQEEEEVE